MDVPIDIEYLSCCYFYFDKPVCFDLKTSVLNITPVLLKDSMFFLSSVDIINIDKNSFPNPKIIQMSYLKFIYEVLLKDEKSNIKNKQKLLNIFMLCLGMKNPELKCENNEYFLCDSSLNITINASQFEDIRKIIMFQNLPHFDDEYVNPELKKLMEEQEVILNQDKEIPTLERKIAIIASHTGISKKEQLEMTYRSHCLLFEEVCGEVDYLTTKPLVLLSKVLGNKNINPQEYQWIFKKKKDKFEGYIKSLDSFVKNIGGTQAFKTSNTQVGDNYMQQFNNFLNN